MSKKKEKSRNNSIAYIYGGILVMISAIALLHEYTGFLGELLYHIAVWLFGEWWFLFFVMLIFAAFHYFYYHRAPRLSSKPFTGCLLILLAIFIWKGIPEDKSTGINVIKTFWQNRKEIFDGIIASSGGLVGAVLYGLISHAVSYWGAIIVAVILVCLAIFIVFGFDKIADRTVKSTKTIGNMVADAGKGIVKGSKSMINSVSQKKEARKSESRIKKDIPITDGEQLKLDNFEDLTDQVPKNTVPMKKTVHEPEPKPEVEETKSAGKASDSGNYKLPNINMMLDNIKVSSGKNNKSAAMKKGNELIDILEEFDVRCSLEGIRIGPSVTQFEIKPTSGTRIGKINSLVDNIKMGLAVKDVRIEAPIPGKSVVGVEIPNETRSNVQMKEMFTGIPEKYADKPTMIVLGKDLSGEKVYGEIDKMPHLLIAGATGSGKSVCINSIITTLMLRTRPDEVKMLLIDPKIVEFAAYKDIPHLIAPVISNPDEASLALKKVVEIMENRYKEFDKNSVRNISEYNARAKKEGTNKMPFLIVIIDELADLMATNEKDVVVSIQRITQKARASGIYLITATQRPSTDVITGTIKANIPSRIAFAVSNAIDSRIILDQPGAESLLGYGDMLYVPMGESSPIRIQGVYVSDDEISKITTYCKEQMKPEYDEAFVIKELGPNEAINMTSADPLYQDVREYVIRTQRASTSSIQRYFGFGYNRAARIIDALELEGIVGPANGSKPREVFYTQEDLDNGRI